MMSSALVKKKGRSDMITFKLIWTFKVTQVVVLWQTTDCITALTAAVTEAALSY